MSKELDIQNITDRGTPVPRRIATPAAAHSVFKRMLHDDSRGGARHRALIQGMIDGNPPYKDSELRAMGLAHMINVNFLSMRANLDSRAAAGHELFAEVPRLIECKPLSVVSQHNQDVHHHCSIVAEEFTDMVTQWDGFLPAMDMVWRDSDAYGLGVAVWENEWDWRMKAFRRGNLLVNPDASVEISRNDIVVIRDQLPIHEAVRLAQTEDAARARGWKLSALQDVLVSLFYNDEDQTNSGDKYQRSTWESFQQMVRNNEPDYQTRQFDSIRIVHLLVKEVAGDQRITHLIIPEAGGHEVFLYEGHDRYKDMSEVVWWMPYNYGDGYVRSVRGVASYMVQHEDLSNRFLGRVFDAGFLTSSLLLQPVSQVDMSRLQVMQLGPYTIVPSELSIRQSTFQPQLGPLIQLRSVSEQVMKNNTGTYRQHSEGYERDVQKTARQVMEETSKEARYEKSAVAARYTHLDKLYREMFRRVVKLVQIKQDGELYSGYPEAKLFLDRCLARGVDRSFITDWENNFRVVSYRTIGMGSAGARFDITGQVLSMSGSFDEHGKREALREAVAARVGYRHVDRFVSRIDRDQIASNETSIAMLEFNDIEEGSPVAVGSDQLHKVHIEVFAQRMMPIMQAAMQGMTQDAVADARTMELALQHISQHVGYLAQDQRYSDYIKQQAMPFAQEASKALTQLRSEAERVLKAQQAQQEMYEQAMNDAQQVIRDRELEAKILEIQKKYELEALKQQSLNAMRAEKTKAQIEINRTKAAHNLQLKAEEQDAKIALAARESDAKMAIKARENY